MIRRTAKVISLKWEPADKPKYIEQDAKDKKPSSRAKLFERKPNGRVVWQVFEEAKYILTVESEDAVLYEENVYSYIRDANRRVRKDAKAIRITPKFRKNFEAFMQNQTFNVDEKGRIFGLYSAIAVFLAETDDVHE